jgi:phospholipid/cholesterol/gamma-HCH transport system permease protein
VEFLGELIFCFGKLLVGRSRFRKRDFWIILQDCSVGALPIVSLLATLTGTILAFVGAVQLRKFGATIYMTDLVGLAMAREMAAIMTGVIMAGRTGAAFAAQIGSMNVNQEVDALETVGLSPVEFLVLPRTLALILVMPLLTLYANVLGWMGGFLVAMPMNINAAEYWNQLTESNRPRAHHFRDFKVLFLRNRGRDHGLLLRTAERKELGRGRYGHHAGSGCRHHMDYRPGRPLRVHG